MPPLPVWWHSDCGGAACTYVAHGVAVVHQKSYVPFRNPNA